MKRERAEYQRKWYQANKDKMNAYHREYRKRTGNGTAYYHANKEAISEQRKNKYRNDPQFRDKVLQKRKENYIKNKAVGRKRSKKRFDKHRKVALAYGCQCPECKWQGEFYSTQLHFHHKDATTKEYSVSMMGGIKLKRIAAEINKCCVLCACCHAAVTKGLVRIPNEIRCNVSELLEIQ